MKNVSDYAQSSYHFAGNKGPLTILQNFLSARNISPHSKKPVWRVRYQWTTFVMWGSETRVHLQAEKSVRNLHSLNKEKCQIALPGWCIHSKWITISPNQSKTYCWISDTQRSMLLGLLGWLNTLQDALKKIVSTDLLHV